MNPRIVLGLCWILACSAPGAVETEDDPRYRDLLYELRCLVCQNQSLADSDAELAGDLRRRVRELMDQGLTDEQILAHLQERYGDFVLYRPPWTARNIALWVGPFVVLLIVGGLLLRRIRRGQRKTADGLSETEQERLSRLLSKESD